MRIMHISQGRPGRIMTSVSRILSLLAAAAVGASCSSSTLGGGNADAAGVGGRGGWGTGTVGGQGGSGPARWCSGVGDSFGELDLVQCEPTYDAQVAKPLVCDKDLPPGRGLTVQVGGCGTYKLWRAARDGELFLIKDCVYDDSGALLGTRTCSDTGCACGGQKDVVISTCAVGPDRCAAECAVWPSVEPPPAGTTFACPIDSNCRPTYADVEAAQVDGGTCDEHGAISVSTGACGSKKFWREFGGLWSKACVYAADGTLVGSESCSDTGCAYGGQVLGAGPCADAGVTATTCPAPPSP